MIKSVSDYPISTLLNIESNIIYSIPRYQREYIWGKPQWERLFDDLIENDSGYYLGSIICINQSQDTLSVQNLEVVDGQQRLTTISILLASIYSVLKVQNQLTDTMNFEILKLKNKLVMRKDSNQPRLVPQIQNNNQSDYYYVLSVAKVLEEQEYPNNVGNRRVFKAYRYFMDKIECYLNQDEDKNALLQSLLEKVNAAALVKIEVHNHSDAYTLFESLNNRGIPLTAIDLIKNKLLALLEKNEPGNIDRNYDKWKKIIGHLGDDYNVQERFFRQYYNAYRTELKSTINTITAPLATKSNLMHIYEKLVAHDPKMFLEDLVRLSKIYAYITNRIPGDNSELSALLQSLERVQAAPAYLLLLILFDKRNKLQLENTHFAEIIDFLIRFFVRRNATDMPPTRDLTKIFMESVDGSLPLTGADIVTFIKHKLTGHSATDEQFKTNLSAQIYDENKSVCRFVLCSLEEEYMTRERQIDLWEVKGKQYVWTIEHIFPQGENIPQSWVDMVAQGDVALAKTYLDSHVHKLGNLTISGYNSSLGNKSFSDKRDRVDNKGKFVGYKNNLHLNQDLENEDDWTIEKIDYRTNRLVERILNKYSLTNA